VGFADPPEHTRLRRAVTSALSARGVAGIEERAGVLLHGMVDEMLAGGTSADLTERILAPFPIAVICELMGVPAADRQRMHTWTQLILSSSHGVEVSERAKDEMAAYFAALVRERDGSTAQDIASLLGAAVGRGELNVDEAVGLAVLIQIGGEAVTNNSGQMFYLLLTRPELLARLRSEPQLRAGAVDELLRYIPHRSAVGLSRIALEDVLIKGVRIRAGEPVYVSYLAANRDPDVFPDPDRIDIERTPNPHVAFGHGPHYCPGGILARMEAELLVQVLLDRLPGLRLAVRPDEVPWRSGALIRGPEALPVAW
jgi:biflaviolin synthase